MGSRHIANMEAWRGNIIHNWGDVPLSWLSTSKVSIYIYALHAGQSKMLLIIGKHVADCPSITHMLHAAGIFTYIGVIVVGQMIVQQIFNTWSIWVLMSQICHICWNVSVASASSARNSRRARARRNPQRPGSFKTQRQVDRWHDLSLITHTKGLETTKLYVVSTGL